MLGKRIFSWYKTKFTELELSSQAAWFLIQVFELGLSTDATLEQLY